jgi:hypothetical protein
MSFFEVSEDTEDDQAFALVCRFCEQWLKKVKDIPLEPPQAPIRLASSLLLPAAAGKRDIVEGNPPGRNTRKEIIGKVGSVLRSMPFLSVSENSSDAIPPVNELRVTESPVKTISRDDI